MVQDFLDYWRNARLDAATLNNWSELAFIDHTMLQLHQMMPSPGMFSSEEIQSIRQQLEELKKQGYDIERLTENHFIQVHQAAEQCNQPWAVPVSSDGKCPADHVQVNRCCIPLHRLSMSVFDRVQDIIQPWFQQNLDLRTELFARSLISPHPSEAETALRTMFQSVLDSIPTVGAQQRLQQAMDEHTLAVVNDFVLPSVAFPDDNHEPPVPTVVLPPTAVA